MIQTSRLFIHPLTYGQLVKYIRADHSLEAELQLKPAAIILSPDLKEAMEQVILPNVADSSKNYLLHTLWTIFSRTDREMLGDLCFTGAPNEAGEIEIGYGTHEKFRGQGIMTEAVNAMMKWAAEQPGIRAVIATTNKDNPSSQAVLKKNGFVLSGETTAQLHWKYPVSE